MARKKKLLNIDAIDINHPEKVEDRIRKLQIKRDFRWFDRYVMKHEGDAELRIYQLAAAAPLIYLQRKKIQKAIADWMREEGAYSEKEIKEWSMPRYEWPEVGITKKQSKVLKAWRKDYQIKDRTDWTKGIMLSESERAKLDKYRQVAILQPRQSGKSEIIVRVNIYTFTIVKGFEAAVFAPTQDQAKDFIFQRTRDYIEDHVAYKGRFKTLNALDMTLSAAPIASGSSFIAQSASPTANIEGDSLDWAIVDESQDVTDYKIKKSIKYMMAAKRGAMIKVGTVNTIKGHFHESTTKKGQRFWHQVIIQPDIVAATRADWAEFIENAIEEDGRWSDTVRMSIFLEWLTHIGMFLTDEQWENMLDPELDWVEYDKEGLQFAVIDVAKKRDETICMVIKVDPNRVINGRYPFRVLNCLAMQGVDYDSQYERIKSWLDENYNVAAVGVDDTGGRGGIADRFEKTSYRVEKFEYTRPTKSEWYTNLSTIINKNHESMNRGLYHEQMITIPASENAQKQKIFRDFEQQMMDLQREYTEKYLVVHHPDIEGAKDDYGDCLMMGAWMASRVHISLEEMQEAIEEISETQMDKVDWSEDVFGSSNKKRDRDTRRRKAQKQKKDDELEQITSGASDLDQPDW